MHNHYFILKRAAAELESRIQGLVLKECFSQQKNELVLDFEKDEHHFFIRVFLYPTYQSFYFTREFAKARGQVFHCFHDVWNKALISVEAIPFDRCLKFTFEENHILFLKLYGRRANLILWRPDQENELYHRHFQSDETLSPENHTGRSLPNEEQFDPAQPLKDFPVFDKLTEEWLLNQLSGTRATYIQFLLALQELENNPIFVRSGKETKLSLLPIEDAKETNSALEALEWFNRAYMREHFFEATKQKLLSAALQQKSRLEKYIKTATEKRKELEEKTPPDKLADILMANMHAVPQGVTEVELYNFYNDQPIKIKLKKELSPQKNAEQYYRKAKNQKKEFEELDAVIEKKRTELHEANKQVEKLQDIQEWNELKLLDKQQHKKEEEDEILPYKQFMFQGWEIRVGKNSKSNDELTQRYSHKDDLWLHARDAAGSHVLIKYQSGKIFPKPVIEKAAQLAAWYSKRKTDSLCPVIVTPKKYVRKKKGAAPGSVIIEREDVVMVKPESF